jgi:hypothetical protein
MELASARLRGVFGHDGRGRKALSLVLAGCVAKAEVTLFDAPEEDRFAASRTSRHGRCSSFKPVA